jgi:hypothetical protein
MATTVHGFVADLDPQIQMVMVGFDSTYNPVIFAANSGQKYSTNQFFSAFLTFSPQNCVRFQNFLYQNVAQFTTHRFICNASIEALKKYVKITRKSKKRFERKFCLALKAKNSNNRGGQSKFLQFL